MARRLSMAVFLVMVLAALLHSSEAQTTHVVGDALGWTIPPGGAVAYSTWAATQTFTVGDILVFNFTTGTHNVAEVTRAAAIGACNATSPISLSTTGPANVTLSSAGEHYYICTFPGHCNAGQVLAINVSAASMSPAPQPATPPPAATPPPTPSPVSMPPPTPSPVSMPPPTPSPMSGPAPTPSSGLAPTPSSMYGPAPTPSSSPQTHVVGGSLGWIVPPGSNTYQIWASNQTFMVGDTLVFNFLNGTHDVAEVTGTAYQSCNTTSPITHLTTPPVRINLTSPGEHFYICTFPRHCSLGQQLAINVTGTTATSPSGSTTPTSPPPPGGSAPSLAAVFPITFLSMALAALLY